MSKAGKLIIASLLVLVAAAYWIVHSGQAPGENLIVEAPAPIPIFSSSPAPSVTEEKTTSLKDQVAKPPLVSDLREEARQNPHETPPSLLRFGADIGVRMKEAQKNKAAAVAFLAELKTCAVPPHLDESPVQARALCIVSAHELAQAWPDLSGDVDELVENSDSDAVQLAAKIR
jgi:hypothetical protein